MSEQKSTRPRNKDSMRNILIVALSVCLFFSVAVSTTAVALKPMRQANADKDRNRNILEAAGLYREGETRDSEIPELFERFEMRLLDLESNLYLQEEEMQELGLSFDRYDQRKAARDRRLSRALSNSEDLASISRQARYVPVYLLREGTRLDKIVLPVHGYGLWSTLYGFVALEGDARTVAGITFYEHQETPGLGGEVDNPRWKALWKGKMMYRDSPTPELTVVKGVLGPTAGPYRVDGLSGATLTTKGVNNLIRFWMGEAGYGPFLAGLRDRG